MKTLTRSVTHSLCVLLTLGVAAGCDTLKTNADYNRAFDFSHYRTFSWISDNPAVAETPLNPLTPGRIQLAIVDVLQEKGITFVSDPKAADFVVAFTVGAHEKVRIDTTNYPIGYRGPYTWGWGYYQDIDVHEYTQGRLAIDVFDTQTRQPVWHGWGTKNVTSADQKNAEHAIRNAVDAILKDFPPTKSSS